MTDLGLFSRCREVDLNGNPVFTSLPDGFQSWPEHKLRDTIRDSGIVDLPAILQLASERSVLYSQTRDYGIALGNQALLQNALAQHTGKVH